MCITAGTYSPAPENWVYEPVLVDKWGFLAKTILVLERLKGIFACLQVKLAAAHIVIT